MSTESLWLLLVHRVPSRPDYLRVKVGRQLQRLGAVAVKNSVYALPRGDRLMEGFQWVARQVRQAGGEAVVCEARLVEGLTDGQVKAIFRAVRDADYAEIVEEARRAAPSEAARLKRRLEEVGAIDFFEAPGRSAAVRGVEALEQRLARRSRSRSDPQPPVVRRADYRRRTWVTRKGVEEDRIASAWLIRRFIDSSARFRFVPARGYKPAVREVRFDMFDAEFTHEADRCTFEVLAYRFCLRDPAVETIGRIIHDIDLRDDRFNLPQTPGLESLIRGIVLRHAGDRARLERGTAMLDDLYEALRRKP